MQVGPLRGPALLSRASQLILGVRRTSVASSRHGMPPRHAYMALLAASLGVACASDRTLRTSPPASPRVTLAWLDGDESVHPNDQAYCRASTSYLPEIQHQIEAVLPRWCAGSLAPGPDFFVEYAVILENDPGRQLAMVVDMHEVNGPGGATRPRTKDVVFPPLPAARHRCGVMASLVCNP